MRRQWRLPSACSPQPAAALRDPTAARSCRLLHLRQTAYQAAALWFRLDDNSVAGQAKQADLALLPGDRFALNGPAPLAFRLGHVALDKGQIPERWSSLPGAGPVRLFCRRRVERKSALPSFGRLFNPVPPAVDSPFDFFLVYSPWSSRDTLLVDCRNRLSLEMLPAAMWMTSALVVFPSIRFIRVSRVNSSLMLGRR